MGLIITRAPLRISFAGGGTDLPAFFDSEPGAVLSATIDKYVYVIINPRGKLFRRGVSLMCAPHGAESQVFQERDPIQFPIRISYSSVENVHDVAELRHPIVREAFRMLKIDAPMDISTIADVPAGTGLGSSSTFAVALLQALHTLKGDPVSPAALASEAARLEIEVLGRPVGKQDHYAAAFGGLNLFEFLLNADVTVEQLPQEKSLARDLFGHILLFYTGIRRDAAAVLNEQKRNTPAKLSQLVEMRDHAYALRRLLTPGFDKEAFAAVLHETWLRKRTLASGITSPQIDRWYERARGAGALGGKICGAGGGGFLLVLAQPDRHDAIRAALAELPEMAVAFEPRGCCRLTTPELAFA